MHFFSFSDKADWLGLDDKTDAGKSAKTTVGKDEDLSSQTSLQGGVWSVRALVLPCSRQYRVDVVACSRFCRARLFF